MADNTEEVINKFLKGKKARAKNIISTGKHLISYHTIIGMNITPENSPATSGVAINNKFYSNTTSRHQNELIAQADAYYNDYSIIITDEVRIMKLASCEFRPIDLVMFPFDQLDVRDNESSFARKLYEMGDL